ncbi:MAG: hypothetical protein M3423_08945 [Actinomycetota bacterium]|nr:hypothetical protein [Actinomycetota bacterium]
MNAARAPEVAARRSWAYRLLRRCSQPPPIFGSREWLELPEGTPAKIGAVVAAAECWAQDAENVAEDLRHEIDVRRESFKRAEDADYQDRAQAHRAEWSRLPSSGKSFAERRAEQLASVKPRPGDYTGRGSA